jgi:hypothetical protein
MKHLVERTNLGKPEMQKLALKAIEKVEKLQGTRNLIVHTAGCGPVLLDAIGIHRVKLTSGR